MVALVTRRIDAERKLQRGLETGVSEKPCHVFAVDLFAPWSLVP